MNVVTREQLEAELGAIASLLAKLHPLRKLERLSLEQRKLEVLAEIAALPSFDNNAKVLLSFAGAPVLGSAGIDAQFAGQALAAFQELVTSVHGTQHRDEPLGERGSVPEAPASRLLMTNTVPGSFGFALEEIADPTLFPTKLADAVDESLGLIEAASKPEQLEALLGKADGRVLADLKGFVETLAKHGATLKLTTTTRELDLDAPAVERAADGVQAITVTESTLGVDAVFLGARLSSRDFNLRDAATGTVFKGSIAKGVTAEVISEWDRTLMNRRCRATLRVRETKARDRVTFRYTLLDLARAE